MFDCKGRSRVRNDNNVNDQVKRNFTTDVDSIEPTLSPSVLWSSKVNFNPGQLRER